MMDKIREIRDFLGRLHRDESGQAMTEAAIILPLFVTVIAMTLELSVLATTKSVVNYAAYSACRAGIVHNADPAFMVPAASMAISPVTQSNVVTLIGVSSLKPGTAIYDRYGKWSWEDGSTGDAFMDASVAERVALRTANFATQTLVALAHFTIPISIAEYAFLGVNNDIIAHVAQPFAQMAQGASDLDFNALAAGLRKAQGLPALVDISLQPINRIQILQPFPATSEEVVAESGGFNPLTWNESDISLLSPNSTSLLTEGGNSKEGVDWVEINAGRNNYLVLRVRMIHRHMLMFPFLRAVYDSVLDRRDVSDEEMEIYQLSGAYGMVELWGDAAMKMHSNFTLGQ